MHHRHRPGLADPWSDAWNPGRHSLALDPLSLGPGGPADDTMAGTAASETLRGLGGDDLILAGDGDDTLAGDAGDDHLEGGAGNDAYLFAPGFGNDTVADLGLEGDSDRLVFRGLRIADATIRAVGGFATTDLLIDIGGSRVTVTGQYTESGARIERAVFDDGVVDLRQGGSFVGPVMGGAGPDRLYGTPFRETLEGQEGDDTIAAEDGSDLLVGGAGQDFLTGGAGPDVYGFGPGGFGADTISDFGRPAEGDAIRFEGHDREDASLRLVVDGATGITSLLIDVAGGGSVLVSNQYWDVPFVSWQVERVVFDDGRINLTDGARFAAPILGTAAAETLVGSVFGEVLRGRAGDDHVAAGNGDDTLAGGAGRDLLSGAAGDDTYEFAGLFGRDEIADQGGVGDVDRLVFPGVGLAAAAFVHGRGDLFDRRVVIEGQGSLILRGQFESFEPRSRIESAVFDDAVVDLTDPALWQLVG